MQGVCSTSSRVVTLDDNWVGLGALQVGEMAALLKTKLVADSKSMSRANLDRELKQQQQRIHDVELQTELKHLIEHAEAVTDAKGGAMDDAMQADIDEALEVAERMLKEQRERPLPAGFRFTIDEAAHAQLREVELERVTAALKPHVLYPAAEGADEVHYDDDAVRPMPPAPRTTQQWVTAMYARLAEGTCAQSAIDARIKEASSAMLVSQRPAGFSWLPETTISVEEIQAELANVARTLHGRAGFTSHFSSTDADADQQAVRTMQRAAEHSAQVTLRALEKLQPGTVPLEEEVQTIESELEADATLATQQCDMLAPGYLQRLDLEIAVQVESRGSYVNEERAAYETAARKRRLDKVEVELQRESRKMQLESELLSTASVAREQSRMMAAAAAPQRERTVPLALPGTAAADALMRPSSAEPNTDVVDRAEMTSLAAMVRVWEEDTWATAAVGGAAPQLRHEHAATVVKNTMLVFGGRRSASLFGDVHALDLRTMKWEEQHSVGPPARAASGHVAVTLPGGLVAVLGGLAKDTTAEERIALRIWDPACNCWSSPAMHGDHIPSARAGFSVCELGGSLWLYGGEDANRDVVDELWVLHMASLTWSVPPMSTSRISMQRSAPALAYHTATALDNRFLVVFGGMDADGDCSAALYFLDSKTQQWIAPTVMGEAPAVRAGHAAALLGNRWLLAGGSHVTTSLCLNLATLEAGFVRWEAPVRAHAIAPVCERAMLK